MLGGRIGVCVCVCSAVVLSCLGMGVWSSFCMQRCVQGLISPMVRRSEFYAEPKVKVDLKGPA